jgi:hypothetical protein
MKTHLLPFLFLFGIQCLFAADFYVDDNSNVNDVFTAASVPGSDAAGVPGTATNPFATLKFAVGRANAGDRIFIDAGTYTTEVGIIINKALTITGAGINLTLVDNNYAGTATNWFVHITVSNVIMRDFTITEYENNGTQLSPMSGQAITVGGGASLISGILLENLNLFFNGLSGGNPAIQVNGNSQIVLRGGGSLCNTTGTAYTGGVGVLGRNINVLIEDYILSNNYKDNSFAGGGLRVEGDATTIVNVFNSVISNNDASNGGGIYQRNGVTAFYDCLISGNRAGQTSTTVYGGGFCITAGTAKFSRCIFRSNSSSAGTLRGAAIAARFVTDVNPSPISSNKIINLQLDSCIFDSNTPSTAGSDIYAANGSSNACNITARDCRFLSTRNFNIMSDGTSPASSVNVTFMGTAPVISGSNITSVASTNAAYTATPNLPSFTGSCNTSFTFLPVELTNFEGKCSNAGNIIKWTSAREEDNLGFMVQRAEEDMIFKDLAFVDGNFSSNESHDYSYTDYTAADKTVYYRLQQFDYHSVKNTSNTIAVRSCNSTSDEMLSYFPNPVKNILTLNIKTQIEKMIEVEIYNSLGVLIKKVSFENSNNHLEIDLQELETGNYFARLNIDDRIKILKIQKS